MNAAPKKRFYQVLLGGLVCLIALDSSAQSDSLLTREDSLEIAVLAATRSYRHIETTLKVLPPSSPYLDLLPSVLPIEVPLEAFRITSPFGVRRHPLHKDIRFHSGVDVKAKKGLPVKATAAGIVVQTGQDSRLGAFVRIRHAFGFETTYGHLSGYCVQAGQRVDRSQEVGRVGQSGEATGPHLHYTIKKNGSNLDPFEFCFLLRRRLWLRQISRPTGSGSSVTDSTARFLSKG